MNNGVSDKVKKLVSEIDELTIEEKTKLVEEVLKTSDLQVVMGGGNFISAEVVLQIQSGSTEQLTEIFQALAKRVGHEGDKH